MYSLPSHHLNIPMDNGNCVCLIRVLIDQSPVLFPEYPRPFSVSTKTTPKHPSLLSLVFLHYTSGVPFLTSPACNPSSGMPPASYPSLVRPEYLIPLRHCPFDMLKCPGLAYLLVLLCDWRLAHSQ